MIDFRLDPPRWLLSALEFALLLVFFGVALAVVVGIEIEVLSGVPKWRLEHVAIALVPPLLYLIVNGQLSELYAGNFGLALQNEARTPVTGPGGDEPLDVSPDDVVPKEKVKPEVGRRIKEEQPDALSIEICSEDYSKEAIRAYVNFNQEHNPNLDHIVFLNQDGTFEGVTTMAQFESLLYGREDVIARIENGTILNHPTVVTRSVESNSTRGETLDRLNAENLDFIAVVDSAGQYVTTITVDDIVRQTVTSLLRRSS